MEPIDLRLASVREARNADRRFCFEVITPQYKRVYQATSEEDMNSWISSINNALQSAVEGRGLKETYKPASPVQGSIRRDIGSILTGKSSSTSSHHGRETSTVGAAAASAAAAANSVFRRTTVGARPGYTRANSSSFEE